MPGTDCFVTGDCAATIALAQTMLTTRPVMRMFMPLQD
jgi:hypothetical protein